MAVYCAKNKRNSQQIQKLYKNKHRDEFDDANWSTNAYVSHPMSFGNACNGYQDADEDGYNTLYMDEYDEHTPSYWTCTQCTFDNTERELYCSICNSPFKSTANTTKYASDFMTFGDHLPSVFNDMVHLNDDMDESIQIAILTSYHTMPQPSTNQMQTETYDTPRKSSHKTEKQLVNRAKVRAARAKRDQRRLKRERDRAERDRKQEERRHIAKCTTKCPKLSTVVGDKMVDFIASNIKTYYGNTRHHIKLILKYNILLQFLSSPHANDTECKSEWEFVYHGTDSGNNTSIIDKGLIVGGTKGVRVKNGTCHGRGVYCSPHTSTAKCYERGSMFICIVRKKRVRVHGHIWVVPSEKDILPLYLVSFGGALPGKLEFPYFPISAYLQSIISPAPQSPLSVLPLEDGMSQQLIKFIPSFKTLNQRNTLNRKIKRKWSAYHKINRYTQS
eukprot:388873_1